MGTGGSVLAVDLGGTNLRVAAIAPDGRILHRQSAPTRAEEGPGAVITRMGALCEAVAEEAGISENAPIGVASPAALSATNMACPCWIMIPRSPFRSASRPVGPRC